jgi:hypothetical protein
VHDFATRATVARRNVLVRFSASLAQIAGDFRPTAHYEGARRIVAGKVNVGGVA